MPDHRCRLCTVNDREALTEELAAEFWASQRDSEVDPPWETASPYWQIKMREFASCTIDVLTRSHG